MRALLLRSLLFLVALAAPGLASAFPNLEGHVTDPQHRLSVGDRTALEKKLGEIQSNTHIDVACWISDAQMPLAQQLGEEAYKRWGIGREWDNGVFFMFPLSGPVRIILDPAKPVFDRGEIFKVAAADRPNADVARRMELLADAADAILREKARAPRPWGTAHPQRGLWYALGSALVALLAAALSFSRKGGQPEEVDGASPAVAPAPAPAAVELQPAPAEPPPPVAPTG